MAGIYIHIPYCVQACHYCDFHFSTNRKNQAELVDWMLKEIELRKNYLSTTQLDTVYFGGGTPSVLERDELAKILDFIRTNFVLVDSAELTMEVNPDDITEEKLLDYKTLGINRLSIGIQTFDDAQLVFLNRAHTAAHAIQSVKEAKAVGFSNISIDLIYGIPSPNHTIWEKDLDIVLSLDVQHISSYCLTIEPKTVFGHRLAKKEMEAENEVYNADQFEILIDKLQEHNFEQYEVSNFSKAGYCSQHNSNYWHGEHYLGIGPGAHSYDGNSRQYNVSNNTLYIQSLKKNELPVTIEQLDSKTQANEYIMTKLRTKWGIDYKEIEKKYNLSTEKLQKIIKKHEKMGNLKCTNSLVILTKKGLFIADKITEDLFYI